MGQLSQSINRFPSLILSCRQAKPPWLRRVCKGIAKRRARSEVYPPTSGNATILPNGLFIQGALTARAVVQGPNQKPIVWNPRMSDINDIPGRAGESESLDPRGYLQIRRHRTGGTLPQRLWNSGQKVCKCLQHPLDVHSRCARRGSTMWRENI